MGHDERAAQRAAGCTNGTSEYSDLSWQNYVHASLTAFSLHYIRIYCGSPVFYTWKYLSMNSTVLDGILGEHLLKEPESRWTPVETSLGIVGL